MNVNLSKHLDHQVMVQNLQVIMLSVVNLSYAHHYVPATIILVRNARERVKYFHSLHQLSDEHKNDLSHKTH